MQSEPSAIWESDFSVTGLSKEGNLKCHPAREANAVSFTALSGSQGERENFEARVDLSFANAF